MIRAGEIRKGNGQIQFSLTVLDTTRFRPGLKVANAKPAPSFTREGVNLSGSQVLVGFLSALLSGGLLLWAFLRLWLFEQ
jgi:hypothetical protein